MEEDQKFQDEIKELMQKKGNVKGEAINFHAAFIIHKAGKEGLKKVEKKLIELGYPVEFDKLVDYKMYPASLAILVAIVAVKEFNWSDDVIREWGKFNLKNSFVLKMLLRYFISLDKLIQVVPKYWRKEYDFGSVEITKTENEKEVTIRIKDYDLHPVNCIAFGAMAEELIKYVVRAEKIWAKETKCMHQGDEFHEYIVNWQ